jgi:hypothetical protein
MISALISILRDKIKKCKNPGLNVQLVKKIILCMCDLRQEIMKFQTGFNTKTEVTWQSGDG